MFSFKNSTHNLRTMIAMRPRPFNTAAFAKPQQGFFRYPMRCFAAPPQDNFMSGSNANYIDYMYAQW